MGKLRTVSFILYLVKSLFVCFFSLKLDSINILLVSVFFDIFFLLIAQWKGNVFFFSYCLLSAITFLLYFSYLLESGGLSTYGGDDEAYLEMVNDFKSPDGPGLSIYHFISNRYTTYVYLIYFISWPFDLIGIEIDFPVTLCLFNVAIGSFVFPLYANVYRRMTGMNALPVSIIVFTPLLYYSIVNREVVNYLLYGLIVYLLTGIGFWIFTSLKTVAIFTLMYFLRPETSFSIIALQFFNSWNSVRNTKIFIASFLLIMVVMQFYTKQYIKTPDQGQRIYFNYRPVHDTETSIGALLRYSDNPVLKVLNYFHFVLSPIPPYFIKKANFENFFLSIGQLFWYFVLFMVIRNYQLLRKYINTRLFIANVLVLAVYIYIIAFHGGTQRHYYAFFPLVLFCFDYVHDHDRIRLVKTLKEFILVCCVTTIAYVFLKYVILG